MTHQIVDVMRRTLSIHYAPTDSLFFVQDYVSMIQRWLLIFDYFRNPILTLSLSP